MKLDKIASTILQEAEVEREKIISSANAQAKEIIENKKSELEGINLEKLTQFEQEIEKMVVENVASKRLTAKREVQVAKDQIINKALIVVRDKFFNLKNDEKKYSSLLKKLYTEAVEQFNGDEIEVYCSKEDEKIMKNISKIQVISSKEIKCGGLIVKSKKKRMIVDFTFETLLRDKESEIKEVISRTIFKR